MSRNEAADPRFAVEECEALTQRVDESLDLLMSRNAFWARNASGLSNPRLRTKSGDVGLPLKFELAKTARSHVHGDAFVDCVVGCRLPSTAIREGRKEDR
jgi:hypothetical protein